MTNTGVKKLFIKFILIKENRVLYGLIQRKKARGKKMKLRILTSMEKAYDSLYDLNSRMGNRFEESLELIEKEAKTYGYNFKLDKSGNKFKLYVMTKKEWDNFRGKRK